ncbi:MAG: LD-carboxypeptidase [Holdemanella sp.]|nr:LD-carboxypeptidase [Holdemanella sp.]
MKIGLLGLSNPCSTTKVNEVLEKLKDHEVYVSAFLCEKSSPIQRANLWNIWMKDGSFDYIYDISGGDLANECIPYLDFEAYKNNKTIYAGYSDCTVILNSLYTITKKPCLLYQIRNTNDCMDPSLYDFELIYKQEDIHGIVIGGNIRCLLKLAGTPYFPDCKDKILFLESFSGNPYRIRTYFAQLKMMDKVHDIKAILLGQFTELDENHQDDILYECAKEFHVPIYRTRQIGHSHDSKALWIGKEISL